MIVDMRIVAKLLSQITELCGLLADDRICGAELTIDDNGSWEVVVKFKYHRHEDINFFWCGGYSQDDLKGKLEAEIAMLTLRTRENN